MTVTQKKYHSLTNSACLRHFSLCESCGFPLTRVENAHFMENFALKLDQYGCRLVVSLSSLWFFCVCGMSEIGFGIALCNFKQFFSLKITNFLGHASRVKKNSFPSFLSLSLHLFCVHHLTYKFLILSLRYLAYVCGLFFLLLGWVILRSRHTITQ